MVSWVMLTLRAHPTTYHPSHSVPRRCSKYGPSSFRQKNKPEMCASTKSRIKDVRSPSHPTDRQSSDANLSQIYPVMGRKAPTAKELLEKAAARSYQPGTQREKDVIKEIPKYVQKTLKDQNWALDRYVKYVSLQL